MVKYEEFLCIRILIKNSCSNSRRKQSFVPCFSYYIFNTLRELISRRSVFLKKARFWCFPQPKHYVASYPCLLQGKPSCAVTDKSPGRKLWTMRPPGNRQISACVLSWSAHRWHLAFSCVAMELLDPVLVPVLNSPGLFQLCSFLLADLLWGTHDLICLWTLQ